MKMFPLQSTSLFSVFL